jgi:ABC-type Mn2+/Zn2+ transport system ATPase subunit
MDASDALVLDGLDVGYDGVRVVTGLTLRLAPGGALALIGTNGSGKSTVLKTLAGLLTPLAGRVEVAGGAPGATPAAVAYLCQNPPSSFTLPLRAADIVSMGRFARLGLLRRPGRSDHDAVASAMTAMGVHAFADRSLMELSGGQQQRTHLAQVLARRADVLLVDEPTAGLDAAGRAAFAAALLAERARGCAVVIATHDLDDAEAADLVVLLGPGLVAMGPPAEVLTDANLRHVFGATGQHHGPHGH